MFLKQSINFNTYEYIDKSILEFFKINEELYDNIKLYEQHKVNLYSINESNYLQENEFLESVSSIFSNIWEGLKKLWSGIVSGIVKFLKFIGNSIMNIINKLLGRSSGNKDKKRVLKININFDLIFKDIELANQHINKIVSIDNNTELEQYILDMNGENPRYTSQKAIKLGGDEIGMTFLHNYTIEEFEKNLKQLRENTKKLEDTITTQKTKMENMLVQESKNNSTDPQQATNIKMYKTKISTISSINKNMVGLLNNAILDLNNFFQWQNKQYTEVVLIFAIDKEKSPPPFTINQANINNKFHELRRLSYYPIEVYKPEILSIMDNIRTTEGNDNGKYLIILKADFIKLDDYDMRSMLNNIKEYIKEGSIKLVAIKEINEGNLINNFNLSNPAREIIRQNSLIRE